MDKNHVEQAHGIAERVIKLADELEASADVKVVGTDLETARAALHKWIDTATGFVVTPAFGRVTIIHGGRQSSISSAELPYAMSIPIGPRKDV
jgi:hypothetical protein